MKTKLTPRDFEQLSAYLDGMLGKTERADLEKRLLTRADLAAGLEELRQTRAMLRAAPRRRAPRNFTLTPQMVPARRKIWRGWTPTFSFASAASALVAIAMLVSRFVAFGAAAPMAAAPASVEKQSAPQTADLQSTTTPMIITWGNPGFYGMGGGGGGGAAEPGLTAPNAGSALQPTIVPAEPTAMPNEPLRPMSPTPTPPSGLPEATNVPPLTLAGPTPTPVPGTDSALILGIAPTEQQGVMQVAPVENPVAQPVRQSLQLQPFLTIGLIVAAVLFAVAAILLRRR